MDINPPEEQNISYCRFYCRVIAYWFVSIFDDIRRCCRCLADCCGCICEECGYRLTIYKNMWSADNNDECEPAFWCDLMCCCHTPNTTHTAIFNGYVVISTIFAHIVSFFLTLATDQLREMYGYNRITTGALAYAIGFAFVIFFNLVFCLCAAVKCSDIIKQHCSNWLIYIFYSSFAVVGLSVWFGSFLIKSRMGENVFPDANILAILVSMLMAIFVYMCIFVTFGILHHFCKVSGCYERCKSARVHAEQEFPNQLK